MVAKRIEEHIKALTVELMKNGKAKDEKTVKDYLTRNCGVFPTSDVMSCIETYAYHSQFNKVENIERW